MATLLLTAAAKPTENGEASIADQNARAAQQAFEGQLSAAAGLMRDSKMSEKGIATVLAGIRSEQKEQWRIFEEESAQQQAIHAAADAEPFDAAAFEAALMRFRNHRAAAFSNAINSEIEIFRGLTPEDRRLFARLMHTSSTARLGIPARPVKGSN